MVKFCIFLSITCICLYSPVNAQSAGSGNSQLSFTSISGFKLQLESIANLSSAGEKEKAIEALWGNLVSQHRIPLIAGDSVLFLFRGKAKNVSWAGDFNGWDPGDSGSQGRLSVNTGIWMMDKIFPSTARLDYKIVVDKNWINDPSNPNIQYSGFGPNSELRMPAWKFPEYTIFKPGIAHGQIGKNQFFTSKKENLNYKIQFRVYLPVGYERLNNLPVIYVLDGEEYSNPKEGSMIEILDNLIFSHKISPLIAVFIDPCNPDTLSQNRRMQEYRESAAFLNFVCKELVPHIDSNYHSSANPDQRAILGTSLGGWTAGWFGLKRPDIFHLIAIQSPAFSDGILEAFSESPTLPLKIFMSTGTIHDTQLKARKMKNIFEEKKYPLLYIEVSEGHSWGNWRALTDDILIYFFPASTKTR